MFRFSDGASVHSRVPQVIRGYEARCREVANDLHRLSYVFSACKRVDLCAVPSPRDVRRTLLCSLCTPQSCPLATVRQPACTCCTRRCLLANLAMCAGAVAGHSDQRHRSRWAGAQRALGGSPSRPHEGEPPDPMQTLSAVRPAHRTPLCEGCAKRPCGCLGDMLLSHDGLLSVPWHMHPPLWHCTALQQPYVCQCRSGVQLVSMGKPVEV